MSTRKPKKGDAIEVVLEGLDEKGRSVGTVDGMKVRMRDAVPGSRVRARVLRRRRRELEAVTDEVLEPGPDAVEPRCPHFGTCGGCSRQDLSYGAQLTELGRLLQATLEPLEPLSDGAAARATEPVVGCPSPWGYRNKMDFTFGARRWIESHEPAGAPRSFALGLHVPGRFDKVLDVERCEIAFPEANAILADARALALELGLEAWDVHAHEGLLRHLVLRRSWDSGEILASLITTEEAAERVDPYVARLLERHPEITTLVHGVNARVSLVAVGETSRVLHGSGRIHERLGGLRFAISPESFFQTNTPQAEALLGIVREEARLVAEDVLFDLYCGAGALTLGLLHGSAATVAWGFELVEPAVADAVANAAANGIEGARFVAGDLAETLGSVSLTALGAPRPSVAVVDPPRAGMHPRVVSALAELAPSRVVYVSCQPKSAVRDILLLGESGYRVKRVRPIDLFPHTPHLECVFTLERRTADA